MAGLMEFMGNLGGLTPEEKKQRAADRKARNTKSFLRTPPNMQGSPPALGFSKETTLGLQAGGVMRPGNRVVVPTQSKPKYTGSGVLLTNRYNPEGEVLGNVGAFKKEDKVMRNSPNMADVPYNVSFDSSVDSESKARFMQAPVRPTAQIDRYNSLQGSVMQPTQNKKMPEFTGGWKARLAKELEWMKQNDPKNLAEAEAYENYNRMAPSRNKLIKARINYANETLQQPTEDIDSILDSFFTSGVGS